jgi:DNA gyrase/topoisomerase IV subunit A
VKLVRLRLNRAEAKAKRIAMAEERIRFEKDQQGLAEEQKLKAEKEAKRLLEEQKLKEEEAKQLVELEKKRQEEQRMLEEEKDKLEQEKRKLQEARQAELDRKQQKEEAKQFALEEQIRKEEEAANARVTVVFFRKSTFLGGGFQVSISNNGTSIGKLPNGSFFIHTSPVGKQTFATDKAFTSYGFSNTFEFNPGQIYYIQLLVGGEEGLELVSQSEGREGIKKLKNTGNINPADVLNDYDETEAYQAKEPPTQRAPL